MEETVRFKRSQVCVKRDALSFDVSVFSFSKNSKIQKSEKCYMQ